MADEHVHVVESQGDSGMGFLLGVVVLIAFFLLFFYYGLPILRNSIGSMRGAPQINVPDKINVDVQQKK